MPNPPNNLLVLARTAFQGGNYGKALGFCESLLTQVPDDLWGWIIKGRCELHVPEEVWSGWAESHASLLRAAALAQSEVQKRQVLTAWMESFGELMAGLERRAAEALAEADSEATAAGVATLAGLITGYMGFNAKSTVGKLAGFGGMVGSSAAVVYCSHQARAARISAVAANLMRCAICVDTLTYLESLRPMLAGNFLATVRPVAEIFPQALGAAAVAQRGVSSVDHLQAVDIAGWAGSAAKYAPRATQCAVGEWVKFFAWQQMDDPALKLIAGFSTSMGVRVSIATLQSELARHKRELSQALRPFTDPPAWLFLAFWLVELVLGISLANYPKAMVLAEIMVVLAAISMSMFAVGGLYCAIKINAVLKRCYPRFKQSGVRDTVELTLALALGIFTGWYPRLARGTWVHRAAINRTFLCRFPTSS